VYPIRSLAPIIGSFDTAADGDDQRPGPGKWASEAIDELAAQTTRAPTNVRPTA
jgi:hypothetical protein